MHLGDRLIIWHLARELSARGYTFDLCALTQSSADTDDIPEYASFFDTIHLFPERQRTPLMYLQRLLGRHYPRQAKQAWQPELWRTVETLLTENDYDAIHLFGGVHVYELAYLLKDQPTVITPYESFSLYLDREWQQHQQITTLLNRTIARQFESWMFTPYDITTVLTEQDADVLASLDKQLTLEVIPNGIDLEYFETSDTVRDEATLLFVGNYAYPPNHDAALVLARDIFPQVQGALPQAKLLLVGNAPTDEMHALASDSLIVTGRVPRVQDYLAQATVFVCPLRVGAGIKNKVLEALAMEIPTVATPLSMEGIHAEDGKHVIVADIPSMPQAIVRLLKDASLRNRLSANSRALIEAQYSWEGVALNYATCYERVSKN
ncbi:MAG: glycosyltransferase family 4 protein [Chloroflexota bacterium]